MTCNCNKGLRFAFQELDVKTKPFLQLSNCQDAALLANALTIIRCACGQIQGCKTSSICTSISDFIRWSNDASFVPNSNTGRAVALLKCATDTNIPKCPPDLPECFICEDGSLAININ